MRGKVLLQLATNAKKSIRVDSLIERPILVYINGVYGISRRMQFSRNIHQQLYQTVLYTSHALTHNLCFRTFLISVVILVQDPV